MGLPDNPGMPSPQEIHWLLFGAVAGLLIYLSGVGAGVIVVPIMVTLFGIPVATAVGTASLFSVACKIAAGLSHIQQRNVSKRLLKAFLPTAVVACLWLAAVISLALPSVWPEGKAQVELFLKLRTMMSRLPEPCETKAFLRTFKVPVVAILRLG